MNKKIYKVNNTEDLVSRPSVDDYYNKQNAEERNMWLVVGGGVTFVLCLIIVCCNGGCL